MNLTFYDKIFKPKEYVLPNGKKAYKKASRAPIYVILVLAMCALSVKITGFDMEVLVSRIGQFFVILGEKVEKSFTHYNFDHTCACTCSIRCSYHVPF